MINAPIFKQCNNHTDFFRVWTCINGFTMDFTVDEPQWVVFSGGMDIHHRGLVNGVIGVGTGISLLAAPTLAQLPPFPQWSTPPGEWLTSSINTDNIISETDHYGKTIFTGAKLLQPGAHRVMVHANSHTSISGNTIDGLAEVLVEGGQGRNCLIATFFKA
jgi:hypothetical protein